MCRTSVFQSYGTARYWTGEAKNKGKQKMRVWNARFWNATPRNATGLREKTKKEKKMTKFHASFMENIFKFWTSEIEFIYKWKMEIFFYRNNDFSVEFVENYFSLNWWKYIFHWFCGIHFSTEIKILQWNSVFHRICGKIVFYSIDEKYIFHKFCGT